MKSNLHKLYCSGIHSKNIYSPYVSDEHIELLCNNVNVYANKLNFETLCSVKAKELLPIDIFHFGWNMWNYFRIGKQIDIAHFLKKVFPNILKDAETETIKIHLKDEELKGIIKFQNNNNHNLPLS